MIPELEELVKTKPTAHEFLQLYATYCDLLDDQIDECKNNNRTRKLSSCATSIFNCAYWQQYSRSLFLLERTINNCYFDSVAWEHDNKQWRRETSKHLASCGIMMIVAVLILEFGEEVANHWSSKIREEAYNKHKDDAML